MLRSTSTALLLTAFLAAAGAARAADESTVSGTGMVSVEKQADTLRLQVDLQVEGPTLKDALDKLKTRREAVKAALLKLEAVEASYEAGESRAVEADQNDRAAMNRMMRERMNPNKAAAAAAGPKTVTVACSIKLDWTLKGATPEELLLSAASIKDQIKASKALDVPKTPAQEEAAAEAAAEAMGMNEGPAANEPMYLFVAKVSEAELAKATADAFAKAKAAAARLAKAAGSDLGNLRSLAGQSASSSSDAMYSDYYSGGGGRYMYQRMLAELAKGSDKHEAFSSTPGKVSQEVVVEASFLLK